MSDSIRKTSIDIIIERIRKKEYKELNVYVESRRDSFKVKDVELLGDTLFGHIIQEIFGDPYLLEYSEEEIFIPISKIIAIGSVEIKQNER